LIEHYPADRFGISYNVGKRPAGFSREELAAYGHRVVNVRLKHWTSYAGGASSDRNCTHLSGSIAQLRLAGYRGNLILQPSLSSGCRAALLAQYGAMAATWWSLGEPDNLSLAHGIAMASSDSHHELAPSC
jgi:L-ribulose-5-phosphate 3-epimerase